MVDSNDTDRIDGTNGYEEDNAKEELHRVLAEDELRDAAVLVFANKQDLPNAMTVSQVTERMGMQALRGRQWMVQAASAKTGEGIYEGMEWLSNTLNKRKK